MSSLTPLPVYEEYLSYCSPFVLPDGWNELSLAPVAYSPLASPFVTLGRLQSGFDRATLIDSGLAVPCGDELIWPAPFWMAGGTRVIPLRREPSEAPFDLITHAGSIRNGGGTIALVNALADGATVQALAGLDGRLLITPHIDDMIVSRSLGFPTMTASGLHALDANNLRQLRTAFGWTRAEDQNSSSIVVPPPRTPIVEESHDADGECEPIAAESPSLESLIGEPRAACPQLVLIGFQLGRLSLDAPPGLAELVESLASLQRDFGCDLLGSVWLWKPTREEVRRLERCLSLGDLTYVREALLESLDASCVELIVPDTHIEMPDLVTARANLLRAEAAMAGRQADRERWERTRRHYEAALDRDFRRPIVEQSMAYADPLDRALGSVAGDLAQQVLMQGVDVLARLRRLHADGAPVTNPQAMASVVLREYFNSIKALLDVRKGLNR